MIAIFKREFKSYFINMSGYLFVAVVLLFTGIFVTAINLVQAFTEFEYPLQNLLTVFLLIIPILTMRSVAEDKHAKTDSLLYSLPIKLSSVVLGKYLTMLAVLVLPILVMCVYPLILSTFGSVSFIGAYTGIFGLFLLGAALIAICMFMSSLTESQVIAAVSGFGVTLLLYFMGTLASFIPSSPIVSLLCLIALECLVAWLVYYFSKNIVISVSLGALLSTVTLIFFFVDRKIFEGLFASLLKKFALFDRFNDFTLGLFDVRAILFYLSFTVFFVFLTVQSLEKKRYS